MGRRMGRQASHLPWHAGLRSSVPSSVPPIPRPHPLSVPSPPYHAHRPSWPYTVITPRCPIRAMTFPPSRRIMSLAVPIMAQNVFGYLLSIVCTIAIGRLGAPELAASSLANSVYIVTGMSLVMGLSSAMEPLCGQAYGAKDYKTLGDVLQRALLVCWVACIPVALLWSQSTALMVAAGQDPVIAGMAAR